MNKKAHLNGRCAFLLILRLHNLLAQRPRAPAPRIGVLPGCSLLGFLTVSSIDRMRQAASDEAANMLILTTDGSHTNASKLSAMFSLYTSTPNQVAPISIVHCKKFKN